jgi:hypothetical protein
MNTLTHDLAASLKALLPTCQRALDNDESVPDNADLFNKIITAEMVLDAYDLDVATLSAQPGLFRGTNSFGPDGLIRGQHQIPTHTGMACWEPEEPAPTRVLAMTVIVVVLVLAALGLYVVHAPQCRAVDGQTVLLCVD